MNERRWILSIDPGTTFVRAVIGEVTAQGVQVAGVGEAAMPEGMSTELTDRDALTRAIEHAAELAMQMAGVRQTACWCSVPASWTRTCKTTGTVPARARRCTPQELRKALEQARLVRETNSLRVLHQRVIRVDVDGVERRLPFETCSGRELRVDSQLFLCSNRRLDTLHRALLGAGLKPQGMLLETLGAGSATLNARELERGVALVDIGASKTVVGVWRRGVLEKVETAAFGGRLLTEELAEGLRVPLSEARRLKEAVGCALVERADTTGEHLVAGHAMQSVRVSQATVAHILEPLILEFLSELSQLMAGDPAEERVRSVVFTGGTSWLDGLTELAAREFAESGVSVRLGVPGGVDHQELVTQTKFAVAVGVLLEAARSDWERAFYIDETHRRSTALLERVRAFFDSVF